MKCDETLPHCQRCTDTGRKCEGPANRQLRFIHHQQGRLSSSPTTKLQVSVLTPPRAEAERRAFHFFTGFAAPLFAGVVDARFWKELVPQLAQTYDFVWDSVVSLSSLLEHAVQTPLLTGSDSPHPFEVPNRQHQQALRLYNRAISSLRQLAARDQIDNSIIALSYILFSSVEFQQWNVKTGIELLRRCCKISIENITADDPGTHSTTQLSIHQVVTPFVSRKAILTATLGCALPLQWPASDETAGILNAALSRSPALAEARSHFYTLVGASYELIRLAEFMLHIGASHPVKITFLSDRKSLLDRLQQWKTSATLSSNSACDAEIDWIWSYLLMYWAFCYTCLATCLSTRQTLFDEHMDRFTEIIQHAQTYLRHSAESTTIQSLACIGPGALPPLYFCATKCRHPRVRREAQRLMRLAPPQGNGWAFVEPDRVVARIISLEEGGRGQTDPQVHSTSSKNSPEPAPEPEPASTSQSAPILLPPEERRFAFACVVGRRAPGGRLRRALELGRFAPTPDGSTHRLITNYAWLDDEEVC